MKRNIINPDDVTPFLNKLKARFPSLTTYIDSNVKNYILKKENTFLLPEESMGFSLWLKKVFKQGTKEELSMLKHQGVFGNYFKLNLNEACLERYSSYLQLAASLEAKNLPRRDFKEIIILARKEAYRKIKIHNLIEGRDFKYVGSVKNKYALIKLSSLNSYINEGKEMSNCVGTAVTPVSGRTMYSLRNEHGHAVMTINTDSHRNTIVEAKGYRNSPPDRELLKEAQSLLRVKGKPPLDVVLLGVNFLAGILSFLILNSLIKAESFFRNALTPLSVFCFSFLVYFLYSKVLKNIIQFMFIPFHGGSTLRRSQRTSTYWFSYIRASSLTGVLSFVVYRIGMSHFEKSSHWVELLGPLGLLTIVYLVFLLFIWSSAGDNSWD